jgi:hypothetical protein
VLKTHQRVICYFHFKKNIFFRYFFLVPPQIYFWRATTLTSPSILHEDGNKTHLFCVKGESPLRRRQVTVDGTAVRVHSEEESSVPWNCDGRPCKIWQSYCGRDRLSENNEIMWTKRSKIGPKIKDHTKFPIPVVLLQITHFKIFCYNFFTFGLIWLT